MSALRLPTLCGALLVLGLLLGGADGCASDPNVEGAKLYIKQDNYEQALTNLETALAENPDNAEALRLKGQVLRLQAADESDPMARRAMVQESAAALRRVQVIDPESAAAADNELLQLWGNEVNNGVAYLKRESNEDILSGAAAFENSTLVMPDSALGYFNQAFALIRAGENEGAIEPLQAAIARGEESADAYLYLARIYAASSVPDELLEAARLDGAGEVRTFFSVSVRLMVPALVTVYLFQFVAIWNNFFLPLIMLRDESLFPVTLGLYNWNTVVNQVPELRLYVLTGSLVSIVPLIVVFLLLQRFWRTGLGTGSLK